MRFHSWYYRFTGAVVLAFLAHCANQEISRDMAGQGAAAGGSAGSPGGTAGSPGGIAGTPGGIAGAQSGTAGAPVGGAGGATAGSGTAGGGTAGGGTAGSGTAGGGGCEPGTLFCGDSCVEFVVGCTPLPASFKPFSDSALPGDAQTRIGADLVTADFNGDGFPDVAIAEIYGGIGSTKTNAYGLMTWLGLGDGTFSTPSFLPTNQSPPSPNITNLVSIKAVDLDGDSRVDLLGNDQSIGFYRGIGDGTLAQKVVSAGPPTGRLVLGDFDGDAILDVAATDDQLHIWHGVGKGIFEAVDSFVIGDHLTSTTAADVDGDGFVDILTTHDELAGTNESGSVQLLLGSGKGTFSAAKIILDYPGATRTAVADLDENGIPDIVIISIAKKQDRIAVLLGKGNGKFASPAFYKTQNHPSNLQLADINGDQHLDLVLGTDHGPEIFLSRANGTFDATSIFLPQTVGNSPFIAVEDMNKDGKPDFIISQGAGFTVYLNTSP
jgi:hypothetical protein